MIERWPNLFIVGAPRAGTNSLWQYFKLIPGIMMCPIKEPNYFSASISAEFLFKPYRKKQDYLDLFKNSHEQFLGDASPQYLWDAKAPKLIHEVSPDSKIIITLRNPIKRAYSHYLMLYGIGNETRSFSEAIRSDATKKDYSGRIIQAGFYYESVKRYLEIFGQENVKIIIFEDFVKDTEKIVKGIIQFLGINANIPKNVGDVFGSLEIPNPIIISIIRNPYVRKIIKKVFPVNSISIFRKLFYKKVKKKEMLESDTVFLQNLYNNDVKNLEFLLNKKLPWSI